MFQALTQDLPALQNIMLNFGKKLQQEVQVKNFSSSNPAYLMSNLTCASLGKTTSKSAVWAILVYEEFVFMLQKK